MDLMLKKGKENRLNRFLRAKNARQAFTPTIEKRETNSQPVVSTVSGLVDMDINESNAALDDKSQFLDNPQTAPNPANSTLKKAVNEPINKLNDLKSKSNGYESFFNTEKQTQQSNAPTNQNQDEQGFYKSSKLLKMFNNFIYAKEIRSSHDVFFDTDDSTTSSDGHRSKIDRLWKISSAENKHESNDDQKY